MSSIADDSAFCLPDTVRGIGRSLQEGKQAQPDRKVPSVRWLDTVGLFKTTFILRYH